MAFGRDMTPDEMRDQRIADLEAQVRELSAIIEKIASGQPYRVTHGHLGLKLIER